MFPCRAASDIWIADASNPLVDLAGLLLVAGLLVHQIRRRRVSIRRLWLIPVALLAVTGWSLSVIHPSRSSGGSCWYWR